MALCVRSSQPVSTRATACELSGLLNARSSRYLYLTHEVNLYHQRDEKHNNGGSHGHPRPHGVRFLTTHNLTLT